MNSPTSPVSITVASYKPQKQARYSGNRLIEALPLPLEEDELFEALKFVPPLEEGVRDWSRAERLQEVLSLTNIMIPLSSHIELGLGLDSMMREGCVGRQPFSAKHIATYQEIEDEERSQKRFRQTYNTVPPKLSKALIAVPGMGKTTTIQRCLARYPRVIYHPELDLYQIPWLHFEMPSDGKGVKSLLTSIIEAISELIPDNTYYEDYVLKGRPSESSLQSSVRRLMNKHFVGLLVPDEVQNAANSRKEDQVVMTELTTLANKSNTPVLFVGTPKARKVLGLDLRMARRSTAGLGDWNPLPRYNRTVNEEGKLTESPGEWVDFMFVLWQYMWVRNPVPLSEGLLDVIYDCTQGIIDLAIKLLILAQTRAILDGSETLSEQLFYSVYEQQFKLVHPMVSALRSGDDRAMAEFDDLKLFKVKETVEDLSRASRVKRGLKALARPGTPGFEAQLAQVAETMGIEPADAEALASQVATDGNAKDLLDAVKQLTKKATPPKAVGKKTARSKAAGDAAPAYAGLEERPEDFRRALVRSAVEGTTVFEQFNKLKFLPNIEDVICLA
ncbi:AAA family ATPase [Roseateles sp.]|uniref:AAA family ATPase n=1 Tax=Roseateles sp. TaxID=1971397 RepID=UPI0039ED4F58